MDTLEQRTIAKVSSRLLPFLIVCYFVAYLDRVNVGFAALTMNKDLGLSAASSASAPASSSSAISSSRSMQPDPGTFGARRWIARIMFSWGLISGAFAFVRRHIELLRASASCWAWPRPASFPA